MIFYFFCIINILQYTGIYFIKEDKDEKRVDKVYGISHLPYGGF